MTKMIFALLALMVTFAGGLHAADYDLKDKNILGRYVLNPANKQSSVQSAEIRFDADSDLNIYISHTGGTYQLKTIDKDGVIVGGEPDPDCEDCSEGESDPTRIRLVKGQQNRPRLIIETTWSDSLDEDGKNGVTVTYVLDWATTIPNAVSFYLNTETPQALQTAVESCSTVVTPAVSDDGPITSDSDVCPSVTAVKLRTTLEESLPFYLKDMGTPKGAKEISVTEANLARAKEENYFAKLSPKGLKVKADKIAGAFRKISDYFQKNTDRVFARESDGTVTYYMFNSKDHVLTVFALSVR